MASTGNTTASATRTKKSKPTKKASGEIRTFKDATDYLDSLVNVERMRASRLDADTFKLDRIRALCAKLGDPQKGFKSVHIAGTNGKGSTVGMLEHALRACNVTVGTFTSPHLTDPRERVCVGGQMLSHASFAAALEKVRVAAEALPKKIGAPTYFEAMTALAFVEFEHQAVDLAIIEVGMGGRLDSTNIIEPVLTAITRVDADHTQFLGSTHAEIAREKAGIFKPGVPALTIPQEAGAMESLRAVAAEVGATLEVVSEDIEFSHRFEAGERSGPHVRVGLTTPRVSFEHVPVPLPGEHQAFNCGLVLAMVDKLGEMGFDLPEPQVFEGLAETTIPGRMELAWKEPRVLLDGAHNPAAMSALIKTLGAAMPYDSMVLVFGCAADKDMDAMLEEVARGGDKIVFTKSKGNIRAADPNELASRFSALSPKMHQVGETLDEAIKIAARAANRGDLIVVTGSFYLVGEAKRLLAAKAKG